jgi:hypothetical protein
MEVEILDIIDNVNIMEIDNVNIMEMERLDIIDNVKRRLRFRTRRGYS